MQVSIELHLKGIGLFIYFFKEKRLLHMHRWVILVKICILPKQGVPLYNNLWILWGNAFLCGFSPIVESITSKV